MSADQLRPGGELAKVVEAARSSEVFASPDLSGLLDDVLVAAEEAERCGRRSLVPLPEALAVTLSEALAHQGTLQGIMYLRELLEMVQPDESGSRG